MTLPKKIQTLKAQLEVSFTQGLVAWILALIGYFAFSKSISGVIIALMVGASGLVFTQGRKPKYALLSWLIPVLVLAFITFISFLPAFTKIPGASEFLPYLSLALFIGISGIWFRDPVRCYIHSGFGFFLILMRSFDLEGAALVFSQVLFWPGLVAYLWWLTDQQMGGMSTTVERYGKPLIGVGLMALMLSVLALSGGLKKFDTGGNSKGFELPDELANSFPDFEGGKNEKPGGDKGGEEKGAKPPIDPNQLDEKTKDTLRNLPEDAYGSIPPDMRDAARKLKEEKEQREKNNGQPTPPSGEAPPSGQGDKDDKLLDMDSRDELAANANREGGAPLPDNGENNMESGSSYPVPSGGGENFNFGGGMDAGEGRDRPPDGSPGSGSGLDRPQGLESQAYEGNGEVTPSGGGGGDGGSGGGGNGGGGGGGGCGGGGGFTCNRDFNKSDQPVNWGGLPATADKDSKILEYEATGPIRFRTDTLGSFDGRKWRSLEVAGGNKHHPRDLAVTPSDGELRVEPLPDTNRNGEKLTIRFEMLTDVFGQLPHPTGVQSIQSPILPNRVSSEDIVYLDGKFPAAQPITLTFEKRSFHAGNSDPIPRDYFKPYLDASQLSDKAAYYAHQIAGNGQRWTKPLNIEGFLNNRFGYSAQVPPVLSGSTTDVVLFERQVGYCAQFAEIMTLMAREVGLPARVVTGFAPGEYLGRDKYVVRSGDAHAWVEVYLPGAGWLEFDPTPPNRTLTEDPFKGIPPYPGPGWRNNLPEETKKELAGGPSMVEKVKQNPAKVVMVVLFFLLGGGVIGMLVLLLRQNTPQDPLRLGPNELSPLAERLQKDFEKFRTEMLMMGFIGPSQQTPREVLTRVKVDQKEAVTLLERLEQIFYGYSPVAGKEFVSLQQGLLKLQKKHKDLGPAPTAVNWDEH